MAKPIKDTPKLKGKDALRFDERRAAAMIVHTDEKEKKRILQNFEKLKAIAAF